MNVGKIEYAPNYGRRGNWDAVARKYVEHDTLPQETFGPIDDVILTKDCVVDADGAMLRATRESQGIYGDYTPTRVGVGTAANDNRPKDRGPYVLTFTGVHFHPFDPRASEVRIEDIAHGLAHSARYNGAGRQFYSTAEHSVHIARWLLARCGARTALAGLLHDAPEPLSGFGDVLRPVKSRVPLIKQTENNIWGAVAAAFGLSPVMPVEVHDADARIIADEMAANMTELDPGYTNPLGVTLEFWAPWAAELYFLDCFKKLTAEIYQRTEAAA